MSVKGLLSLRPSTAGHTTSSPVAAVVIGHPSPGGGGPPPPQGSCPGGPPLLLHWEDSRDPLTAGVAVTPGEPSSRGASGARKPGGEDAVRWGPRHDPRGTRPGRRTKARAARLFRGSRASGWDGGAACWVPSPQVGDAAVCGLIWLVVAGLGRWLSRGARVAPAPAAFLTPWVSGLCA